MSDTMTQRIKRLREDRGWTQSDLERESGVAQAHVSRLEAGKSPQVSAIVLAQIARALNVSVDYILGISDDPLPRLGSSQISAIEQAIADPRLREIVECWPFFDDSQRNVVHQTVVTFADIIRSRGG